MRVSSGLVCLAIAAATLTARSADACGGCFAPANQTSVSTVTGHRMAFAVSPTRTVLWDQFQYDGSPADFSWVLPVLPGATIEQSSDAWFEALDAVTNTRVQSPQLSCGAGSMSGGCGCASAGASDSASAGGGGPADNGVQVLHAGTVGPYDTVTLHSTDPQALRTWLTTNGYVVPTGIDPVIDAYVSEGWDFIALRLSPGKGVQEMTPVRVVTPGGEYKLPLRMVAAGVGSFVGITLYVIAEQRFMLPDIAEVSVRDKDLSFDFSTSQSNYLALRAKALAQNGGRSFLTSYAVRNALSTSPQPPSAFLPAYYTVAGDAGSYDNFSDLYFAQAAADEKQPRIDCTSVLASLASTNRAFEDTCTDPGCITSKPQGISSHAFECNGDDDIAAAMIGMVPDNVWLSRLELNLPSTALDHDCVVAPAVSQATVSNFHQASLARNAPCGPPSQSLSARLLAPLRSHDAPAMLVLPTALGMLLGRRRRRRTG